MKNFILLSVFTVLGFFVACGPKNESPSMAVADSCGIDQLYSSAHNVCLNHGNCPPGQGALPTTGACVYGEPVYYQENVDLGNSIYEGVLSIGNLAAYQEFLKVSGVCNAQNRGSCYPSHGECPTCDRWDTGWFTLQTMGSANTVPLEVVPLVRAEMISGPAVEANAQVLYRTTTTTVNFVVNYQSGTNSSKSFSVRIQRSAIGQNQVNAEVFYGTDFVGNALLRKIK